MSKEPQKPEKAKDTENEKGKPQSTSKFVVLCYCAALLVSAVGNSIFFKKMTNKMPNYIYFLSQVTTIIYVPFFLVIVVYERLYTNNITPQMLQIPKRKFMLMGALDSLGGLCMMFGGVHTSGSRQALLMNAVIPMTMVLAYFILHTRFKLNQYGGAFTIISGVCVVMLPEFLGNAPASTVDDPLFNIIFLCATIPLALSSIYKEYLFHSTDIAVNYLQYWVAVWQAIFGIFMIPFNTLSILGPNALKWDELQYSLVNGAKCMIGINTIVPPHCDTGALHSGAMPCDSCSGAFWPVAIYLFFNANYNIFIVLVIKYGSASLMYIIMTLRLPLVQLAFSFQFINDPPDVLPLSSIAGLFTIIAGLVIYRWPTQAEVPPEGEEDVAVPFLGTQSLPGTFRRKVMAHMRRSGTQIRSSLYSKLGVIHSPVTPYSPRTHSPRPPISSTSKQPTPTGQHTNYGSVTISIGTSPKTRLAPPTRGGVERGWSGRSTGSTGSGGGGENRYQSSYSSSANDPSHVSNRPRTRSR